MIHGTVQENYLKWSNYVETNSLDKYRSL